MTLPNLELLKYKAEDSVRSCFSDLSLTNHPKIEYICTIVQEEESFPVAITVFKDRISRSAIIYEGNKEIVFIYDANWNCLMDDIRNLNIQLDNIKRYNLEINTYVRYYR